MQQSRDRSAQEAERAEELRERAQDMWDNASDAERERLRRWAAERAGEQDEPPATRPDAMRLDGQRDVVDARRENDESASPDTSRRVVGEWLGEGEASEGGRAEAERVLREAAQSAERAVEERAVPGRYDKLLRDYFRRLPERVLREGGDSGEGGDAGGGEA